MLLPTALRLLYALLPLLVAAAVFRLADGELSLLAVAGAAVAGVVLVLLARQLGLAIQTARWNAGHRVR